MFTSESDFSVWKTLHGAGKHLTEPHWPDIPVPVLQKDLNLDAATRAPADITWGVGIWETWLGLLAPSFSPGQLWLL